MSNTALSPLSPIPCSTALDDIAEPNYDNHPAYGRAFPKPQLSLRIRAVARLAPWLVFAAVKQLTLGDRLPTLPRDGDGLQGGLFERTLALPRYAPYLVKAALSSFRTSRNADPSSIPATTLREDGIATARIAEQAMHALRARVSGPLEQLLRDRATGAATSFKGNQKVFTRKEHGELYGFVDELLVESGLMEAASAYLGRRVHTTRLLLQVNDRRDQYLYQSFPDASLRNSRTNYMHIDRAYGCLKCVVYLSVVDKRSGPFSYVLGSNRLDLGAMGGIVRRAVDRSGLAGCDRETRRLFMALPALLRKKAEFGSDLLDGSEASERLLGAEFNFTSEFGNVAIFDNLGIHRGGLVKEGQRHTMFCTIA